MGCMRGSPVALTLLLCACGDDGATKSDASVDTAVEDMMIDASDPNMPQTLAATGLCVDAGCTQISSDAIPYTPRFELYSDGATKRRWIYLPPGTTINTTDMDFWDFPVGTKLWKEFTRGTTRVETRIVMRVGPGTTSQDWYYAAYVWNATQDATTFAEFGEMNANGTQHDVPARFQCKTCHDNNKPSRILGFSALSLDFDGAAGELDLADLVAMNKLSVPPSGSSPYFPFQATPGTDGAYEAITYMHANCGHCHNANTSVSTTNLRLRLTVGTVATTTSTAPYTTAVDVVAQLPVASHTYVIESGSPSTSTLVDRFDATDGTRMPQIGVETPDGAASTVLKNWISNL